MWPSRTEEILLLIFCFHGKFPWILYLNNHVLHCVEFSAPQAGMIHKMLFTSAVLRRYVDIQFN